MRKFAYLFFLFFIPFIILFTIIGVVDPYGYFRDSGDEEKRIIVSHIDFGYLQHTVDYKRYPKPNVILGSSRSYMIKPNHIPEGGWIQLSMGGANVQDYLQAFWYATQFGKVKRVLVATDLCDYLISMGASVGRYNSILDLINNPQSYFTSLYVMETTYKYLMTKYVWKEEVYAYHRNDSSFFYSALENARADCIVKMQDKEKYRNDFHEITALFRELKTYCDERDIEIVAITPIIYSGLYDIYMENARDAYEIVMKDLVDVFGKVIDFGYPNDFTCNRENFSDPYHISVDSVYINSLWGKGSDYCRLIDKNNIHEILIY